MQVEARRCRKKIREGTSGVVRNCLDDGGEGVYALANDLEESLNLYRPQQQ